LFIPGTLFAQARLLKNIPLHHFQLSCTTCHVPKSINRISENQDNTDVGELKDDINKLCAFSGCHDFEPSLNHPVGVRPNGTLPENMPLDGHSRITCLTCHYQPKSSGVSNYPDGSRERFLHRPEGMQFCGSCHMQMTGTLQKRSHWQFSTRAHLGSINSRSSISESHNQAIGGLDIESRTCLGCHDEVSVTIPADSETPQQRKLRWRTMSDYPIGMSYDNVASRRPGHYRYPLLDRQIRLSNGRVGCGSCHSLYSQMRKHLVMRNQRSAICLKCHNK